MSRLKQAALAGTFALSLAQGAAAAPSAAMSNELSEEERALLLAVLRELTVAAEPSAAPQNYGVASGFGMTRGMFSASATVTDQGSPQNKDADGTIGFGVGLGDPANAIGLDLFATIISTDLSDFAEDGSLGVKLHRRLPGFVPGGSSSVAAGISQAIRWGAADLSEPNYYGTFSTYLPMPTGVASLVTVGYGSQVDVDFTQFDNDDNVFGSLGLGWNRYFDTSVSWTGSEWTAAVGLRPFPSENVRITAGIADFSDRQDNRRAVLTLAWFNPDIF